MQLLCVKCTLIAQRVTLDFVCEGVRMPYSRKKAGPRRRKLWTSRDMAELGQIAVSEIVIRTFTHGEGVDDRKFKRYSTKPIYVSSRLARLKPKGGRRTPGGRYYAGGYAQYKKDSRSGNRPVGARNAVDLVLSGEMLRKFKVLRHNRQRAVIGLTGSPAIYGSYVNEARPWIGFSPKNRRSFFKKFARMVRQRLRGKK